MEKNTLFPICLFLISALSHAYEFDTVLEWEGEINSTHIKDADEFCMDFPGSDQDIKEFFYHASQVSSVETPDVMCSASGVARNSSGDVVDWRLLQGGVGYIIQNGISEAYVCEEGSNCCISLPHICTIQK